MRRRSTGCRGKSLSCSMSTETEAVKEIEGQLAKSPRRGAKADAEVEADGDADTDSDADDTAVADEAA